MKHPRVTPESPYEAVLFDVSETLVAPRRSYGAIYHHVLGEVGLDFPLEGFERALPEVAAEMAAAIPSGTDRFAHFPGGETEYWSRFASRVIEKLSGDVVAPDVGSAALGRLREAFLQPWAWSVYDDVTPTLRALRQQEFRLAVVSNWDSRLPRLLDVLGLADAFETIGASHLEGVEKPDPALFHRVLERLGVEPCRAIHVGNLPDVDVEGARAAGMDAVLIDRDGRFPHVPESLRDLRNLPRRISS